MLSFCGQHARELKEKLKRGLKKAHKGERTKEAFRGDSFGEGGAIPGRGLLNTSFGTTTAVF